MTLVVTVLAVALLVGWLAGGRVRNLGHVRLRWAPLVFVAVGFQVVLAAVGAAGGPAATLSQPLLAASYVALLAFIVLNRFLPGMLLIFVGFALNAAVVIPNGAMPVSEEAYRAAGGVQLFEPGKHRLLEDGDVLPWLADVIPVRPLRTVISVGDLVLAAGVAALVPSLMRRPPPAPPTGGRPASTALPGQGGRDPEGDEPPC